MTTYVLGGETTAAGQGSLGGPEGKPIVAAKRLVRTPLWNPQSGPAVRQEDTLFLLDVQTEYEALVAGGRLHADYGTYFTHAASAKAEIIAGPHHLPGIAAGAGTDIGVFPVVLPTDEFTIEWKMRSVGAAFADQVDTTCYPFAISTQNVNKAADNGEAIYFFRGSSGPNSWRAARRHGGSIVAAIDMVSGAGTNQIHTGDMPADTWVQFAITLKNRVLSLYMWPSGSATARVVSSSAAASDPPEWAWQEALLYIGADADGNPTGPWDVADVHILRYARTPNTALAVPERAITIDTGTNVGTADMRRWAGVFAQYPGWRDDLADGQAGGNGGTTPGNEIRDALFAAWADAGLKLVRLDHVFDKVTVTGSGATVSVSDWSVLDGTMDALVAAIPDVEFHVTLDPTPNVLGALPSTKPSNTAGFAKLCSDAVTHWIAEGYPVRTRLGFWNEPSGTFWDGTNSEFATLREAVRAKLAADHPAYSLNTADDFAIVAADDTPARQVVLDSESGSKPIGGVGHHAYDDDLGSMGRLLEGQRDYLEAHGFDPDLPLDVTELSAYGQQASQYAEANLKSPTMLRHQTFDVQFAAAIFARVHELGVNHNMSVGTFTRMGVLDSHFTGGEQLLGAFTNTNPPKPLPVFGAYQALLKLSGQRVTATSNYPDQRVLASVDGGVINIAYGLYSLWKGRELTAKVAFEFTTALPPTFTWELHRLDVRDEVDGRLVRIGAGDETDLPMGTDLGMLGVGCLQITPRDPHAH